MIEAVRPYDAVGRYGGEESLIVLVEPEARRVASIPERVRANIAQRPVSMDRKSISMSASVDVACSETAVGQPDIHHLLQRADDALYSAKRNGHNQTVFANRAGRTASSAGSAHQQFLSGLKLPLAV
jgi:diguanylate cyclase